MLTLAILDKIQDGHHEKRKSFYIMLSQPTLTSFISCWDTQLQEILPLLLERIRCDIYQNSLSR